ncbi:MAG: hypothetical protein ABWJ42_01220 [Sulfolobales archaeon]
MKLSYLVLVVILFILLGVFGYVLYDWFKTREDLRGVEVYIDRIRVITSSSLNIVLGLELRLVNKGVNLATIDRVLYEIYINNVSIGVGNYSSRIQLLPGETISITSQINLHRASIGEALSSILTSGRFSAKLVIYLYRDTLLGSVRVTREIMYQA